MDNEAVCSHCNKVRECKEVGKWSLCSEHEDLKQYQVKVKKVNTLKRTPIKKKPCKINQVSKKQAKKIKQYSPIAAKFKRENSVCNVQVEGYCTFNTTDVHHRMGKVGFADSWARDNDIPLLIDVRHFEAVCRCCHDYIENNVAWAIENGYSNHRIEKK